MPSPRLPLSIAYIVRIYLPTPFIFRWRFSQTGKGWNHQSRCPAAHRRTTQERQIAFRVPAELVVGFWQSHPHH